jgi:hypothetical protein
MEDVRNLWDDEEAEKFENDLRTLAEIPSPDNLELLEKYVNPKKIMEFHEFDKVRDIVRVILENMMYPEFEQKMDALLRPSDEDASKMFLREFSLEVNKLRRKVDLGIETAIDATNKIDQMVRDR